MGWARFQIGMTLRTWKAVVLREIAGHQENGEGRVEAGEGPHGYRAGRALSAVQLLSAPSRK